MCVCVCVCMCVCVWGGGGGGGGGEGYNTPVCVKKCSSRRYSKHQYNIYMETALFSKSITLKSLKTTHNTINHILCTLNKDSHPHLFPPVRHHLLPELLVECQCCTCCYKVTVPQSSLVEVITAQTIHHQLRGGAINTDVLYKQRSSSSWKIHL